MAQVRRAAAMLASDMGITDAAVRDRLALFGFTDVDAGLVREVAPLVNAQADDAGTAFFAFLEGRPEATRLFDDEVGLAHARELLPAHLRAMVGGRYDVRYAIEQLEVALVLFAVDLESRVFIAACHHMLDHLGRQIFADAGAEAGFQRFRSLKKVALLDMTLVVDALVYRRERTMRLQGEAIRELSTPVLQLFTGVLVLPLIGVLDSERMDRVGAELLRRIREQRARVVVVDVTGIAMVDSRVAAGLIALANSARLMGTTVLFTGISADVSASLVALGIDLGAQALCDLQSGVEEAERLVAVRRSA